MFEKNMAFSGHPILTHPHTFFRLKSSTVKKIFPDGNPSCFLGITGPMAQIELDLEVFICLNSTDKRVCLFIQ